MAKLTDSLMGVMKDKLFGIKPNTESNTPNSSQTQLKIISKNFMSMSSMARDLNVASLNVKELVKVMGGKPSDKEDKVAGSGLTEEERERKLKVAIEKENEDLKPTAKQKDSQSFFEKMKSKGVDKLKKSGIGKKVGKLKDKFSQNKFVKSFQKYFKIAAILGTLFFIFKDSIIDWAKGLWETVTDKFMGMITDIREWFSEVTQKIIDSVREFVNGMIDKISQFFENIGNWFLDKFENIKDFFQPVLEFIDATWKKFMSFIDGAFNKVADYYMGLSKPLKAVADAILPKKVIQFLVERATSKSTPKEEPKRKPQTRQSKKERQLESENTERVRRQQQEKQYSGDDEIVRQRLNLEDKTKTMRDEDAKKQSSVPSNTVRSSDGTPVRDGSGGVVTSGESSPTPSKGDEKPLEVSGVQATIVESLKQSGIDSPKAHANVLATVKAESNFRVQSENLNYTSPDRIQAVFGKRRIPSIEFAQQFVRNPEALANHVYKTTDGNSEPGDGFKYRGRGFIQHTGKNQYAAISKFTGVDLLSNPDALNSPEVAAKAIPWFLLNYKRMKPEDVSDMSKVNKAIAFADPSGQKAKAREASAQQIYASMSSSSGTQVASSSGEVASGQRQQQKPGTPTVINAPTTNNTTVNNHQVASVPQKSNSAQTLASRVA
jgi:putative chitinase